VDRDFHPTATLARFAGALQFADVPAPVVRRAVDLMPDRAAPAPAVAQAQRSSGRVDELEGDPGSMSSRAELAEKVQRLAAYGGAATRD
jgi:hypothetical protein